MARTKKQKPDQLSLPTVLGPSTMPVTLRGVSGVKYSGGFLSDEFHPKLRGTLAYKVFREMRDNDAICGSVYYSMDTMIRGTPVSIEAVDEGPEALKVKDHVTACLDDMDVGFSDFLSDVNTAMWAGFAVHGCSYKVRRGPDAPTEFLRSQYDDGLVGWQSLPARSQDTLQEWKFRNDGRVLGVYQTAEPNYMRTYLDMEADHLLHFRVVNNRGNPEGRSLFRSAYRSWFFLKRIQELEAIGVEKDLVGMLVFQLPLDYFQKGADSDKTDTVERFRIVGERARRGEHECIVMPTEEDSEGKTGFSASLLSSGGRRPIDVNEIIKRLESRIALSLLGEAALLGMQGTGSSGSWAMHSDKTHMAAMALHAFMSSIESVMTRKAIPRLVRACGWPVALSPSFKFGDVETDDSSPLATSISALVSAGVMVPGPQLDRYLRIRMGLPLEDDLSAGQVDDALGALGEAPDPEGLDRLRADAAASQAVPISEEQGTVAQTVTADEAARLLGVNRSVINRAISRGQLPGAKIGGTYRIFRDHLMEHMQGKKPSAKLPPIPPKVSPPEETVPPPGDVGGTAPASVPEAASAVAANAAAQGKDVQDIALNGAQVASLLEIIQQVATREIPRENGIELIQTAFNLTPEQADRLLGSVGRTFFATSEA